MKKLSPWILPLGSVLFIVLAGVYQAVTKQNFSNWQSMDAFGWFCGLMAVGCVIATVIWIIYWVFKNAIKK